MARLAKSVLFLFTLLGAGWFLFAVPFGGWLTMQEFPGLKVRTVNVFVEGVIVMDDDKA